MRLLRSIGERSLVVTSFRTRNGKCKLDNIPKKVLVKFFVTFKAVADICSCESNKKIIAACDDRELLKIYFNVPTKFLARR